MLLKVLVDNKTGFLPMTKTDGEFWQSPKTLYLGESLEVKDFIGYALMAAYKDAFSVIQEDTIKDAVDNRILLSDVQPEKGQRKKRASKDAPIAKMTNHEAALKTAADYSPLAAERIAEANDVETEDKHFLNEEKRKQDAAQAYSEKAKAAEHDAKLAALKAEEAKKESAEAKSAK